MKEKLISYLTANTDRFAERYMSKRAPELWSQIVEATSFLADPLPKQRCWHVLNEAHHRPVCPTTGLEVKWIENRYCTYISQSAKASCPAFQNRCKETYAATTGFDGHWSADPKILAQKAPKLAAPRARGWKRSESWHQKVKAKWDEKLAVMRTPETMRDFKLYRRAVTCITRRVYKHTRHLIQNHHLERPEHQLDHVFSVFDGWRLGVSPEVIAHPSNLRMITAIDNSSKQHRSDKSLDELYCDCLSQDR